MKLRRKREIDRGGGGGGTEQTGEETLTPRRRRGRFAQWVRNFVSAMATLFFCCTSRQDAKEEEDDVVLGKTLINIRLNQVKLVSGGGGGVNYQTKF